MVHICDMCTGEWSLNEVEYRAPGLDAGRERGGPLPGRMTRGPRLGLLLMPVGADEPASGGPPRG
jgi:hypothetical protein